MMKNLTNGWQKAVLLSIVFICATVILLWPNVSPTGEAAFFSLATLVAYLVFHVPGSTQPPQQPPTVQ